MKIMFSLKDIGNYSFLYYLSERIHLTTVTSLLMTKKGSITIMPFNIG